MILHLSTQNLALFWSAITCIESRMEGLITLKMVTIQHPSYKSGIF